MLTGVALALSEVPPGLAERPEIAALAHDRKRQTTVNMAAVVAAEPRLFVNTA
jgi:hypothetical protein